MELESGQEALASDLEQQQAALAVSGELAESESALVSNPDAQQEGGEDQFANADLHDLIGEDAQTVKITKVFDGIFAGTKHEYVAANDPARRKAAKSDLKRESIEEKKLVQKEEQKIEKRAVIRFLTMRGKSGAKIHRQLKEVYGDQTPSLRNVNFWRLQFLKGGRLRLRNAEKCGRRATATTQENIEAARLYVDLNPHAKISEVGKEIGVSHGTAFRILHEHLKLQNFGGKWIPANQNGSLHGPSPSEMLSFANYEQPEGTGDHYIYGSVAAPRRSHHAPLQATASRRTSKQPVSVVTVHPRSRRPGATGQRMVGAFVKSELDDVHAMVDNYFEMEDAQQSGAEGDAEQTVEGNVVMGMAPDGSLYVVSAEGDGGEQQDIAGSYVVQETAGYVVEETNYISYPEASL